MFYGVMKAKSKFNIHLTVFFSFAAPALWCRNHVAVFVELVEVSKRGIFLQA